MRAPTQVLRDEYESLHGRVEMIRAVADMVDQSQADPLRRGLDEISRFLSEEVVPLCLAEEQAELPVVRKLLGAPETVAPMQRECASVRRLARELAAIRTRMDAPGGIGRETVNLRRVLYGLYELLNLHLVNEEEVYLPLLDRKLTPDGAQQVIRDVAQVESRVAHW